MTASYTRAYKTYVKVDAKIWMVYYTLLDEFMHSFIYKDPTPAYMVPIETVYLPNKEFIWQ